MICVLFWVVVKTDRLCKVLDKGKIANMKLVKVRKIVEMFFIYLIA